MLQGALAHVSHRGAARRPSFSATASSHTGIGEHSAWQNYMSVMRQKHRCDFIWLKEDGCFAPLQLHQPRCRVHQPDHHKRSDDDRANRQPYYDRPVLMSGRAAVARLSKTPHAHSVLTRELTTETGLKPCVFLKSILWMKFFIASDGSIRSKYRDSSVARRTYTDKIG